MVAVEQSPTETGLYYLQSRYYNPEWGRFVNADTFVSTGQGLNGYNMFAYCGNNPVSRIDSTGHKWYHWAIAAAVVVVAAAAVVVTAGAAAPALVAVASVANGIAATTTASTVAAGVFLGSSITLGAIALDAAADSGSPEEFAEHGDWETVGKTVGGGIIGGVSAYSLTRTPKSSKSGVCFVAGTKVLTAKGTKEIEKIKAGDTVWAENPETGEKALKQVVQTFIRETRELVTVSIEGEIITTTPEHPFYVPNKGWTDAIHLRAGDILVLSNGRYVTVEKIQHEILEDPITVYNFEVADFHTYYVGNSSVLVHNSCSQTRPKDTSMSTSDALDAADDWLGKGYKEVSPGRFVSADGLRQVRMTTGDILGHGGRLPPHINLDLLKPKYVSSHIWLID